MQKSKCKRWHRSLPVFAFCILHFAFPIAGRPAIAQTPTGPVLVRHDFIESAQGWHVAGDTGTVDPVLAPGGGYITGNDEAIAIEQNFTMVFDVANANIVYANKQLDLTDLALTRLNQR